MQDDRAGTVSSDAPPGRIDVSRNNPCPFLRALVAAGVVDGHVVALATLSRTVEAASGETGLKKKLAGLETWLVALIANGLSPLRLLRSVWSGAELDALRDGPLDKHGSGSRILGVTADVNEAELARLAGFGKDRPDGNGGSERGLTSGEITTYMDANFDRAKGKRRWIDRKLMEGEWPILLRIMGKGEGEQRYLSVAEVRTLFVERRLPERIVARLSSQPSGGAFGKLAKAVIAVVALIGLVIVAIAEFPDQLRTILPQQLAQVLPPALAGAHADDRRLLARPELVDRGPALVPPRQSGHRDLSGALRLVCRAGTAGHSFVHPTRSAQGQRLSRAVRISAESEIRPCGRSELASLRLFRLV